MYNIVTALISVLVYMYIYLYVLVCTCVSSAICYHFLHSIITVAIRGHIVNIKITFYDVYNNNTSIIII